MAHVSSVTHRYASVASVHRFLRDWTEGSYANTKLANAQFARECQRRWGPEGVASSAVDPGAVYSSLWNNDAVFGSFPINRLLSFLYAPPTDAVESVVAAVVEPFAEARERERTKAEGFANAANDRRGGDDVGFRFYARGLFASDAVAFGGPGDARDATSRLARARWVARFALWGSRRWRARSRTGRFGGSRARAVAGEGRGGARERGDVRRGDRGGALERGGEGGEGGGGDDAMTMTDGGEERGDGRTSLLEPFLHEHIVK